MKARLITLYVIQTRSETNAQVETDSEDSTEMNYEEEYNIGNKDKLIKDLNVNLGSADIPRYQS